MKREASITSDGLHRLDLTRTAQPGCMCERCISVIPTREGFVLWALANPSTADAEEDDPTERRGWGFTSAWGYGKMVFVNTTPYRATNPQQVKPCSVVIEAMNWQRVIEHAQKAALIICAWGTAAHPEKAEQMKMILRRWAPDKMYVLGLTKDGTPRHPLYLKNEARPQWWNR